MHEILIVEPFAVGVRGVLLAVFALVCLAVTADAKFAATQGFSGKHGVTCESCHAPLGFEPDAGATARLEGLPSAWDYGTPAVLTVRVEGGPAPNPVPNQPQGGFDLETDLGTFGPGAGMQGLLRFPNPQEATYTGSGTTRRSWTVVWTPPNASQAPQEAHFWLAVVSANGNHVMDGPDTAGERGDRTAKIQASVAPSEAANETWLRQPLPPPVFDAVRPGAGYLSGRVPDFADGALWSLDGGEWVGALGAPAFVIQLPTLAPGGHDLSAVTVWMERTSEPASLRLFGDGSTGAPTTVASSPGVGFPAILLVAAFVFLRRGTQP
jgi:hypothetical protein